MMLVGWSVLQKQQRSVSFLYLHLEKTAAASLAIVSIAKQPNAVW